MGPAASCKVAPVRRDYIKAESARLGRPMEMLWFGHAGRPVLMFPTSVGRFYQVEDFGIIGGLTGMIDAGVVQAVCVDSVDAESWYNTGAHPSVRAARHAQYDAYLHDEVLPFVRSRAGRSDVALFGASFGAYHAMNLACRYPDEIAKAIAMSGLYDIHRFLDGYWDDTCYFHCPTAFVPNMDEAWSRRLARVAFVVATGEHDSLVQPNRDLAAILSAKGVPVQCEIWPGVFGHDWPWWIENLPRFLP
jgi:esterase/lipase superfamily enzyme